MALAFYFLGVWEKIKQFFLIEYLMRERAKAFNIYKLKLFTSNIFLNFI